MFIALFIILLLSFTVLRLIIGLHSALWTQCGLSYLKWLHS